MSSKTKTLFAAAVTTGLLAAGHEKGPFKDTLRSVDPKVATVANAAGGIATDAYKEFKGELSDTQKEKENLRTEALQQGSESAANAALAIQTAHATHKKALGHAEMTPDPEVTGGFILDTEIAADSPTVPNEIDIYRIKVRMLSQLGEKQPDPALVYGVEASSDTNGYGPGGVKATGKTELGIVTPVSEQGLDGWHGAFRDQDMIGNTPGAGSHFSVGPITAGDNSYEQNGKIIAAGDFTQRLQELSAGAMQAVGSLEHKH
jgi:hypothetical protein